MVIIEWTGGIGLGVLSLSIYFPSFFSRSASASISFIGSTGIMSLSSAGRNATLLVRVVTRIEPFGLWGRYANTVVTLVKPYAATAKPEAESCCFFPFPSFINEIY